MSLSSRTRLLLAANLGCVLIVGCGGGGGGAVASPKPKASAPTILAEPLASQTVVLGGAATFTVVATGSGTLTYQWAKDGTAIKGATDASYTLSSAYATDAGTYTCQVTSALNGTTASTTSADAVLAVNSAPVITTQPASQTLGVGGAASFTVAATGNGVLSYQWKKSGTAIDGATQPTYTISAVQPSDASIYSCQVTNTLDTTQTSTTSATAMLSVVVPPVILTQPSSQTLNEGTAGTLSVVATSAQGTLSYQWLKDGAALVGTTSATLSFASITPADAGSYTCAVSNSLNGVAISVVSNAATLSVIPIPATPVVTLDASVSAGKPARVASTQDQGTYASYAWTLTDGTITSGQGTPTIEYTATAPGTLTATVTVTTSAGTATGSASTIVVAMANAPDLLLPTSVHPGDTWMKAVTTPQSGMTYSWSVVPGSATGTISSGQGTTAAGFSADASAVNGSAFQVEIDALNQIHDASTTAATVNVQTGTWLVKDGTSSAPLGTQPTATLLANGRVLLTGGYSSPAMKTSAAAQIYDPVTGQIFPTKPMNVPRYQHTATLLADGTVLVAGGLNQGTTTTYLNSAEIYHPATGIWTMVATNMSVAHTWHTATILADGRVAMIGGKTTGGASTPVIDLYNPATQAWDTPLALNIARYAHTSTLLPGGVVLIAGGLGGTGTFPITTNANGQCELFDPVAGTVVKTTNLTKKARAYHSATLLADGTVLLAGSNTSGAGNTAEIFSLNGGAATATFTLATGLLNGSPLTVNTNGRYQHSACLLKDGTVLLAGGLGALGSQWSAEIYDPATQSFTPTASLHDGHYLHASVELPSGQVVLAGGSTSNLTVSNEVEVFTPAAGATSANWTVSSGVMGSRQYHTATRLADGRILVTGGMCTLSGKTPTVAGTPSGFNLSYDGRTAIYDPSTQTWTASGNLNVPRYSHAATLLANGDVLVTGGSVTGVDASGVPYSNASAELWDHTTGQWSLVGNLANGRQKHAMVTLGNGQVLVMGGDNGANLNTCELYDPTTRTFTLTGAMSEAKEILSPVLLANGKVLVAGGNLTSSSASNAVEVYDPSTATWTSLTPLINGRARHTTTLLPDGRILLAAGQINGGMGVIMAGWDYTNKVPVAGTATEVYDLTLNGGAGGSVPTSTAVFSTEARTLAGAVLLANGKVLLVGGSGTINGYSPTADLYDPATDSFSPAGSLNVGRSSHSVTPMANGDVLVVGGGNGGNVTEIYRPN